jgi:hypothetical protein
VGACITKLAVEARRGGASFEIFTAVMLTFTSAGIIAVSFAIKLETFRRIVFLSYAGSL